MSGFIDDYLYESEMDFGPFSKDVRFKIEDSKIHRSLGDGYKIVEFIALKDNRELVFIEAKPRSFIPNKNVSYLNSKIKELTEKFENSIEIFLSTMIGWQNDINNEIGSKIKKADYSHIKGKCILVINGGSDNLCLEITNILQDMLKKKITIHNLEVIVINDIIAKEYKLIN